LSPILAMPRAKHEVLGFDGRSENSITEKTIFMKETNMLKLDFSSREGATIVSDGVSSPPPHPCGILKESSDENLQTHPTPTLRGRSKPISERKKKNKKTRRST